MVQKYSFYVLIITVLYIKIYAKVCVAGPVGSLLSRYEYCISQLRFFCFTIGFRLFYRWISFVSQL